jgi:hypothetical protein
MSWDPIDLRVDVVLSYKQPMRDFVLGHVPWQNDHVIIDPYTWKNIPYKP